MRQIITEIVTFRDDRNWRQFHTPKDLAISVSLEASELLENFQWKSSEEAVDENKENLKDEIADILIYSMLLANDLEFDIEDIIRNKLEKNKMKYPIEKAYGVKTKYKDL